MSVTEVILDEHPLHTTLTAHDLLAVHRAHLAIVANFVATSRMVAHGASNFQNTAVVLLSLMEFSSLVMSPGWTVSADASVKIRM